jgi:outer membrane protein assembly factor BamE (lipoprotein component of BamABCDE complex)
MAMAHLGAAHLIASVSGASIGGWRSIGSKAWEISLRIEFQLPRVRHAHSVILAVLVATSALSGCSTSEIIQNGYVVDQQTLALAPVGSSREQVLLSLGSPSATATFDAEVFYYISQKRTRAVAFMKPKLVDQSILAVYFNKDGAVDHLAHYSIQDGRVFDMISRTTPTGGTEMTFLMRLLKGGVNPAAAAQQLLNTNQNKVGGP